MMQGLKNIVSLAVLAATMGCSTYESPEPRAQSEMTRSDSHDSVEKSIVEDGKSPPHDGTHKEGPVSEAEMMNTDLHLAAGINRSAALCHRLLEEAEDPQVLLTRRNSAGETALLTAARFNNLECISVLLEYGASINVQSGCGESPLYFAALRGNIDAVRLILNQTGAQEIVNMRSLVGQTPIFGAATSGSTEIIALLLEHGAEVGIRDCVGRTPLRTAAYLGHSNTVEYLRTLGLEYTVLDAALLGDIEFIRTKLAESPGLIGAEMPNGETPLHMATVAGRIEIVRYLLDCGASIDARTTNGSTPLFMAVISNEIDVAAILLAKGAGVNAAGSDGVTALHHAALIAGKEMVQLLLTNGAEVNAMRNGGSTPLGCAMKSKDEEKIRLLKERGAILGPRDKRYLDEYPPPPGAGSK